MDKVIAVFLAFLLIMSSDAVKSQTATTQTQVIHALVKSEHRLNFGVAAARIRSGINAERAYRDLDTMLAREYGDMFWMYAMAGFYHSTKDVISDSLKRRIRDAWKHRTPYRGDTENHFLMYYASLFLMSEVWPDLPGSAWFTGQSSQEIYHESREYLLHWMDEVAKYGMNEFDSPRYHYYFITPIFLLAQYAKDDTVRRKSVLMLELLLADYAMKYVKGNYVGAHSRTFDAAATNARIGETGAYGEYFFEEHVNNVQPDLAFVALTEYQCPEIIRDLATKKAYPIILSETKQGRPTLRYQVTDTVVPKQTYITEKYSLGSLQAGLIQPIQQHTWKLVLHDLDGVNTITGLHPYVSAKELATFFPEEPSHLAEKIESTKAGYSNENKWIGGSPYQTLYQEGRTLFAHYNIPTGVQSQHADLFIPKAAKWIIGFERDSLLKAGKWYELEAGGVKIDLLVAHSDMKIMAEKDGYRLRSLKPKLSYVLYIDDDKGESKKSKQARRLAYRGMIHNAPKIWKEGTGLIFELAKRELYSSTAMSSLRGSGVIVLEHNRHQRILDFNKLETRVRSY
jgi:hypothetical protein